MTITEVKEKFEKEKIWHRKCIIIDIYHMFKCNSDPTWNMRKTAKDLDLSVGHVSESIKISKAINDDPLFTSKNKDRKTALMRLK